MSLPSCACVCQRRSFHTWPRATLPSFPMPSTLLCRTCVDAGHCCIRCTCTSFHSRTLSEHSSRHPVKSQKKIMVSPFPLPLKRMRRNTLYTLRFLLPGARPFPSETRTRDQMLATVVLRQCPHSTGRRRFTPRRNTLFAPAFRRRQATNGSEATCSGPKLYSVRRFVFAPALQRR